MTATERIGRVPWWPVIPVLCLTAVLYFRSFGVTPIYLGGDEARFATAAASIAQTGRSLNGDRMPLFFHLTDSLDVHDAGTRANACSIAAVVMHAGGTIVVPKSLGFGTGAYRSERNPSTRMPVNSFVNAKISARVA